MTPLAVTARLRGAVSLPNGPIALDGLLAAAVAMRDGLPPPASAEDCVPVEIPVAREPAGRFYLATCGAYEVETREQRWVNRRFPIPEAQAMALPTFNRIRISAGAQKSYRLPLEAMYLVDDTMRWWCIGDRDEIVSLLALIPSIGKKRSTGHGTVAEWSVSPCEVWEGFPVLRYGQPLRPLPQDWPGLLSGCELAYRTLTYPYWRRDSEELCAVPAWT